MTVTGGLRSQHYVFRNNDSPISSLTQFLSLWLLLNSKAHKEETRSYRCTEQKRGQGQAADNSKHWNIYLALECIFLKHKNRHSTAASTAEKGNTSVHIGKHSRSTAQRWGPCQSQDILWNSPLARPAPTPGPFLGLHIQEKRTEIPHPKHRIPVLEQMVRISW